MSHNIEDYALIGDCETSALVARNGSVDWLCWPRFDSGACFAALLGDQSNGHWQIAPEASPKRITRRYRDHTLILETTFETDEGEVMLVDFMPPREHVSDLVRMVFGRRGSVRMHSELIIRFDYGSLVPWVTRADEQTLLAICGPDMLALRSPVSMHGKDMTTHGEFTVHAGEMVPFVLSYGGSHLKPPRPLNAAVALADTEAFWHHWALRFKGEGPWSEPVLRSLITLKALTYRPTGGIVAAPTASLPEQLGGARNWDYRYCWLRDATFSLLALMNGGYYEEARAWRSWLLRTVAGHPSQVQTLYGLAGEHRLTEWEAPWLGGYAGSRPVRIGNAATEQLQLDIYGEIMDALHHGRSSQLSRNEDDWNLQLELLRHLEGVWHQPDESIWEVRGGPRQFTYSKVMAWVAFDRAVKAIERFKLPGPLDRWRALRAQIHEDVCRNAFNARVGAFVQSYGANELDASVLLMPLVGFLPPGDPRVRSTVAAVESQLVKDGLVLRYNTASGHDGLAGDEGAFLVCSFWLADNLVLVGRHADAKRLFDRLLALRNDVGLLSEEYDPRTRRLIGNFPQAFSHIGLINTAHNLYHHELRPAEQRSGAPPAAPVSGG